ncbi:hypothetical protein B7494_g4821 [Chlorociboria aeruginascens]|nr:hypothetical protein B7494_g4821 [Chlorociboria aeruginascens]
MSLPSYETEKREGEKRPHDREGDEVDAGWGVGWSESLQSGGTPLAEQQSRTNRPGPHPQDTGGVRVRIMTIMSRVWLAAAVPCSDFHRDLLAAVEESNSRVGSSFIGSLPSSAARYSSATVLESILPDIVSPPPPQAARGRPSLPSVALGIIVPPSQVHARTLHHRPVDAPSPRPTVVRAAQPMIGAISHLLHLCTSISKYGTVEGGSRLSRPVYLQLVRAEWDRGACELSNDITAATTIVWARLPPNLKTTENDDTTAKRKVWLTGILAFWHSGMNPEQNPDASIHDPDPEENWDEGKTPYNYSCSESRSLQLQGLNITIGVF